MIGVFLLTRPLRDVTLNPKEIMMDWVISTHTPLAGRDKIDKRQELLTSISTHTPLAGRDIYIVDISYTVFQFLLTRPLRDVTRFTQFKYYIICISTHTPLAGRDIGTPCHTTFLKFLLTRPLRDVTLSALNTTPKLAISTHTPLAGRDFLHVLSQFLFFDFYSHAPCGT